MLGCDSAGAAERSYPTSEARGGSLEELIQVSPGAVAGRTNPTSKERRLRGHRWVERSYSTLKVRRGDLVQGKEQRLHFAGAAVKR